MFLLLIFLLVSSTFRQQYGIDVTLPEARTAEVQDAASHEILISREGRYYFGGGEVNEEELRVSLRNLLKEDPQAAIILRADEDADFGKVVRAMDIARQEGGMRLEIPTRYAGSE